ncbi:MAG: dockerin type I repeat-containing protein [Clostridia bacterium]|nr:dockerin type I repeat-containing protein [Clostridia bacterium]
MKGKKLLCVMLTLAMAFSVLSASVPFVQAADGLTIEVRNEGELAAALNKTKPVSAINIAADFTVTKDCFIRYDSGRLENYSDTVMTVEQGVTLTVGENGFIGSLWPSYEGDWMTPPLPNGKVINKGTVVVENGGGIDADFYQNDGQVIIKNGGEAVCSSLNYGTITVEPGGAYRTTQGDRSQNHGIITVCEGAELESRFGSTIVNCSDGVIELNGVFYCGSVRYDGQDHIWFENEGTVTGSGSVILYQEIVEGPVDMDAAIVAMMGMLGQKTRFENWDDINIFRMIEASGYEELAAACGGERIVAGENVEGDMDTVVLITDDILLSDSQAIRTMANIIIPEYAAVTVGNGGCLEGNVENYGAINVESGGKLYTTMGGEISNYGSIAVAEGAELKSQMGSPLVNHKDASLALNGDFYCGSVRYDGQDHIWFENEGTVTGSGTVVLYQEIVEGPVDMDAAIEAIEKILQDSGQNVPKVRADKEAVVYGDINADGRVNTEDALMALKAAVGIIKLDADQTVAADVNADGRVNTEDALLILKYAVGIIKVFPCEN